MEKSFYTPPGFREKGANDNQCFGIEIVPSGQCDLNCEACYKTNKRRLSRGLPRRGIDDPNETPTDTVLDFANQAKREGFSEVAILGGEPTGHKNINEIITGIRDMELVPILVTNGMNFDKNGLLNVLSDTNSIVVTHAVIPSRPDVMNRYADDPNYANKLIEAVGRLRRTRDIELVLEMPLTGSMYLHAFEFFKFCRENDITPFVEISRRNDNGEPTTCVTPEQIKELFERFREYDLEHNPEKAPDVIHPPAYGNPCTMSMTGLHVKNLGNRDYGGVYSCCAQGIRHGNLNIESLEQIMQSPTLAVFRDQDKYIVGPCKDCSIYDVCKGGCRGEAYLQFGCPRASNPSCHRIPQQKRNDPSVMAPESCEGCPLENCNQCNLATLK